MQQKHLPTPETHSSKGAQNVVVGSEALTGTETTAQEVFSKGLGESLSLEAKKFRQGIAKMFVGVTTFAVVALSTRALLGQESWEALLPTEYVVPGVLSAMLLLSLLAVHRSRKPRQRTRTLTAQVAKQTDVRSVGGLIDVLTLDDGKTHEIAIIALTELLPQLMESDAGLLNSAQRAQLNRFLSIPIENPLYKDVRTLLQPASSQAIAFRVAILQALGQVGDSKALAVVEQIANQKPKTSGEKRIHEAAVACLPTLRHRVEQMQNSSTLLRASQASYVDSDTLLRAVTGDQEAPHDNLLRASESPFD